MSMIHEKRDQVNYGAPMGSSTRAAYYPERARRLQYEAWARIEGRRVHLITSRHPDRLVRKPFFACGEARRHGWVTMIWRNGIAYRLHLARIRAALIAKVVLPLP